MKKKLFLIAITVITIGSSCTNSGEEKRQEIQSEKLFISIPLSIK